MKITTKVSGTLAILMIVTTSGCGQKSDVASQPHATSQTHTSDTEEAASDAAKVATNSSGTAASTPPPGSIADSVKSLMPNSPGAELETPQLPQLPVPTQPVIENSQCRDTINTMRRSITEAKSVKVEEHTQGHGMSINKVSYHRADPDSYHEIVNYPKSTHEVKKIGDDLYMSLDPTGLQTALLLRKPTLPKPIEAKFSDKWVDLQHRDGGKELKYLVSVSRLSAAYMSPWHPAFLIVPAKGCSVARLDNGQLRLVWKDHPGHLLLQPAPSHLPIEIKMSQSGGGTDGDKNDGKSSVHTKFSDWNQVQPIQAPPAEALMSPWAVRKTALGGN